MRKEFLLLSVGLLLTFFSLNAQLPAATIQAKTERSVIDAFMDLRFGVFIHWGPVTLRGTEIGWSRNHQVAQADYDSLYQEFNPVLFDADAWVKAVKKAGAKYLTITAKHHDGFCLWPTKYSNYNISHTPFKKDVVGLLAKACKKYDVKFCIYFTVLDWHDADYPLHNNGNKTPDPKADMGRFVAKMKNQLTELITGYHPYMLWFDGNWESPWTKEMGAEVYAHIKKLDAAVIVNNRLGKGQHQTITAETVGDYATPEQEVGKINMNDPWESCITICKQWSWKPNDQMKSLEECVQTLSRTSGGNGNLLLNISPMPDGRIEQRQVKRLSEMGGWLQQNGTAIYGTKGGPYRPDSMYVSTRKGNRIFLHMFQSNRLEIKLPAMHAAKIIKASFLSDASTVQFEQTPNGIQLQWPQALTGKGSVIIILECDRPVEGIELI